MEDYLLYILMVTLIAGAFFLGKKTAWKEAQKKLDEVYNELDKLKEKGVCYG